MSRIDVREAVAPAEWDTFVRAATDPDEFLASHEWFAFQRRSAPESMALAVTVDGRIGAVCTFVPHKTRFGRFFVLAPRGPIIEPTLGGEDQDLVWRALLAESRRRFSRRAMFLKVEPNIVPPSGLRLEAGSAVHPERTLVIDLRLSEEQLLAALHQKTRYNIRLAERKGVTIRWGRSGRDGDTLTELLRATAVRQGIGIHPADHYRAMVDALGPAADIAVAEHRHQPLAAALLVRFGDTVTYLHGGSSDVHKELMATHLLQWASLRRAKLQGATSYDFFGITPADAPPGHPWAGITRFKLGFGGSVKSYPGAYNVVFQRSWYLTYHFARRLVGR